MWFRTSGFKLYSWIFGCNLDEMKDPDLTHYKNLSEFFYRELKDGARPIDYDAALVSIQPLSGALKAVIQFNNCYSLTHAPILFMNVRLPLGFACGWTNFPFRTR